MARLPTRNPLTAREQLVGYESEVAAFCKDLGLPSHYRLYFETTAAPYIARTIAGFTVGSCSSGNVGSTVRLALGRKREAVLGTLAHELRHAWQTWSNVLVIGKDSCLWKGTQYVAKVTWKGNYKGYHNDPAEADARKYATDACRRLFGVDACQDERPTVDEAFVEPTAVAAAAQRRDVDVSDVSIELGFNWGDYL